MARLGTTNELPDWQRSQSEDEAFAAATDTGFPGYSAGRLGTGRSSDDEEEEEAGAEGAVTGDDAIAATRDSEDVDGSKKSDPNVDVGADSEHTTEADEERAEAAGQDTKADNAAPADS